MIITRTPFRISFFGGGTDFPEWFNNHEGMVLSTTIDKYCYISLRDLPPFFDHKYRIVYSVVESVKKISEIKHPVVREVFKCFGVDNGVELHHDGDIPARSGVGSSSTFTVGLLNSIYAFNSKIISPYELASEAINIEKNILKESVGFQDQIAAAYGGFNKIKFTKKNNFAVEPLICDQKRLSVLNDNLFLFFTGVSRYSSDLIKHQIQNIELKEKELYRISEMVDMGIKIINSPDINIDEFGKLLHQSWLYKKSLSNLISNEDIDSIYNTALKNGAIGGKILGAGGGGFILFYAPKKNHAKLIKALQNLVYVPFKFEKEGSKVVLYNPSGL